MGRGVVGDGDRRVGGRAAGDWGTPGAGGGGVGPHLHQCSTPTCHVIHTRCVYYMTWSRVNPSLGWLLGLTRKTLARKARMGAAQHRRPSRRLDKRRSCKMHVPRKVDRTSPSPGTPNPAIWLFKYASLSGRSLPWRQWYGPGLVRL
jgi:hypothetical protein